MENTPTVLARNIFYLDWNVFSYLSEPKSSPEHALRDIICLRMAIEQSDRRTIGLPYSRAHFADIEKGPASNHPVWIEYLSEISMGWNLLEMPGDSDRIALQRVNNVADHYRQWQDSMDADQTLTAAMEQMLSPVVETTKLAVRNAMPEVSHTISRKSTLNDHVEVLLKPERPIEGIDIMRLSKSMRGQLRRPDGRRVAFPELPDLDLLLADSAREEFLRGLDTAVRNSDFPYSSLDELERSIPDIPTSPLLSRFTSRINRVTMLASLLGVGPEDIKRSSTSAKFDAIVNDLVHMAFGLRCHGFVTCDKPLLTRAKFVCKLVDVPARVITPREFLITILEGFARYYNSQPDCLRRNTYTFKFSDNDGNFIKAYSINMND